MDEDLIALLDEALEAIGPEPSAAPARPAARQVGRSSTGSTAQGLAAAGRRRRSRSPARSTTPAAGRGAAPRKIFIPIGPDSAERLRDRRRDARAGARRATTARPCCAATPTGCGTSSSWATSPAVDRELATYARLADELRMPSTSGTPRLRGDAGADRRRSGGGGALAEEARRAGERAEQPLAAQYYGIQLIPIRSLQGRADELLPGRPRAGRALPRHPGLAHAR